MRNSGTLQCGWEPSCLKRRAALQLCKLCRDAALAVQELLLWCLVWLLLWLLRRLLLHSCRSLMRQVRLHGDLLDWHSAHRCGTIIAAAQLMGWLHI